MRRPPSVGFFGLLAFLIPLTLAACGDAVGPEDAATPSDIAVETSPLRAAVEALAHDSMCGRLAGTGYEREAAQYVADAFERANLSPGGTNGYFQPVLIDPVPREGAVSTDQCVLDAGALSQNVIGVSRAVGASPESGSSSGRTTITWDGGLKAA